MARKVIETEVAVIGGGPAGLCAAVEAATLGADVVVLDEKPAPGGQLFKQIHKFFGSERHMAGTRGFEIGEHLLKECARLRVRTLLNAAAWGLYRDGYIGVCDRDNGFLVKGRKVVIATGAGENTLCFPGWTLPGVMGAGAAQTMVNYYRVRPGSRALMVGSGNVGLIVSYQLLQAGIEVKAIVEALPAVGGYMVHAGKVRRMGLPILTRHTILRAEGERRVERAVICRLDERGQTMPGTEQSLDVDLVCLAVGLSPAVELCAVVGCRLVNIPEFGGLVPVHDENMRSTAPDVYVAGDVTGIEEASTAMEEGRLAGIAAAEALGRVKPDKAAALKAERNAGLASIRQGPFGEVLAQRKQALIALAAADAPDR